MDAKNSIDSATSRYDDSKSSASGGDSSSIDLRFLYSPESPPDVERHDAHPTETGQEEEVDTHR